MANKPLFLTGIGTGIGKTLVASIMVEKLKADYWKPIQSGGLDNSDTMMVQSLVSNTETVFHPEAYRLTQPYSPHKSAKLDNVVIDEHSIVLPTTGNQLVIEGAGGLMVPLNDHCLLIGLIKQLGAEAVLLSQNYLGSINHTILSAEALRQHRIAVKGIIFNGDEDESSQEYILNYTKLPFLGRIPVLANVTPSSIADAGRYLSL